MLSEGTRALSEERIKPIISYPLPKTLKQLRGFLGVTGFCRLWISGYGEMARPLYQLIRDTQTSGTDFLTWEPEARHVFNQLKQALLNAPALSLPTGKKFNLYVSERKGMALGVLTQAHGSAQQPIGYLSKELDLVAKGWPACLRAVAAIALLIPEATKLTLGSDLTVYTPHDVSELLASKGKSWLTDNCLLRYQAALLEGPAIQLRTCSSLNPATFLPKETGDPEHSCEAIISHSYAAREDLKETPLENANWTLFTDGSSFMEEGIRRAGYAVVTINEITESATLPPGTSAQLAELVALTRALELSKDLRVNIYTDSKYAFLVLHAHATIWKERHYLTASQSPIKYHQEINRLLAAVFLPSEFAVMH